LTLVADNNEFNRETYQNNATTDDVLIEASRMPHIAICDYLVQFSSVSTVNAIYQQVVMQRNA